MHEKQWRKHMTDLKYFIDTNIFLRAIVRDDEKTFKECVTLLDNIKKGKISAYTSSLVFAEIQWTMKSFYGYKKEECIKALQSIQALPHLKTKNRTSLPQALNLFDAHAVKFIDALIASDPAIQTGKVSVISYDKDFDKMNVNRVTPRRLFQ